MVIEIPISIIRPFEPLGLFEVHDIHMDIVLEMDRITRALSESQDYMILDRRILGDALVAAAITKGASKASIEIKDDDEIKGYVCVLDATVRGRKVSIIVPVPNAAKVYKFA